MLTVYVIINLHLPCDCYFVSQTAHKSLSLCGCAVKTHIRDEFSGHVCRPCAALDRKKENKKHSRTNRRTNDETKTK